MTLFHPGAGSQSVSTTVMSMNPRRVSMGIIPLLKDFVAIVEFMSLAKEASKGIVEIMSETYVFGCALGRGTIRCSMDQFSYDVVHS